MTTEKKLLMYSMIGLNAMKSSAISTRTQDYWRQKTMKKILTKQEFDLLVASAVMKYKVFRDEESAREVAELALRALNGEVLGEIKTGDKNGSK